eukprot:scaffold15554_cov49-Cylindrotheca_fusiformis.AAC.1
MSHTSSRNLRQPNQQHHHHQPISLSIIIAATKKEWDCNSSSIGRDDDNDNDDQDCLSASQPLMPFVQKAKEYVHSAFFVFLCAKNAVGGSCSATINRRQYDVDGCGEKELFPQCLAGSFKWWWRTPQVSCTREPVLAMYVVVLY